MNKSANNNTIAVLGIALLLFPFVQQRTYSDHPRSISLLLYAFYKYASFLSATIIFFLSVKYHQYLKNARFLYLFALFWFIYIVSTRLNSPSELKEVLINAYWQMGMVVLVTLGCRLWKDAFFKASSLVYGLWISLNFFVFLLYPDGIFKTSNYHSGHILGDDNAMVYVMLPGSVVAVCNSLYRHNRVTFGAWMCIIMSLFCVQSVWAASGFLSMYLFVALLIIILCRGRLSPRLMLMGLFSVILLVIFGLSNPYIGAFIENTLDKDITLTGRTLLWASAIIDISQSPFLGYGGYFHFGEYYIHSVNDFNYYPCHTPYLQIILDGGLTLFFVFVVLVISAFENVRKNKNLIGYVLCAGIVSIMFNYITEHSKLIHLFIIITIMFNVKYLNPLNENGRKRRIAE